MFGIGGHEAEKKEEMWGKDGPIHQLLRITIFYLLFIWALRGVELDPPDGPASAAAKETAAVTFSSFLREVKGGDKEFFASSLHHVWPASNFIVVIVKSKRKQLA